MLLEAQQAMRRGDRAAARDLLVRLVEQDDHHEQAWLWLSEVVDDPADQVTALENALVLNPANAQARARLQHLHPEANASPGDHWRGLLPEARQEDVSDGVDEPLQCVYCSRLTAEKDRRCPHCGRSLRQRRQQGGTSEFLRLALFAMGVYAAVGLLDALAPLLTLNLAAGLTPRSLLDFLNHYGLEWFLGQYLAVPLIVAQWLFYGFIIRSVLLGVLVFLLSQRFSFAYYGALGVLLADLLLQIYLISTNALGLVAVVVNGLFILGSLALLFASDREFAGVVERLYTRPDGEVHSAMDFYKRGHRYRKLGMWALAVAQWRAAVGLAPKEVQYYKDLGVGYAQIQRYERSLRTLEEAQRQAPADLDIPRMIALVREQAGRAEK